MIVDTSGFNAILRAEPDARHFAEALAEAPVACITAATFLETAIVAEGGEGSAGARKLDRAPEQAAIALVSVTPDLARRARIAWRRFGKGCHPAGLNFGDCFAHALAEERGEPLLFKGDEFAQTDVKAALPPHA
ncbi:ribonuclease VapC [Siccirubricoccus deserti]|uniref:Ribonuclease VapC n=1 Tax=Siccirubricoccus deserti TaxID=2013562 RepID=A0A9X0UD73_9PROT|nr:type II toxin-antitoxin system VapC family toxin [Siccirubricoccus deserti]MBC4015253.1 type II toxin-antitoxin system VapC family toxin [Siccirubricoccus deserti]GGC37756.1 ribonuclease VapC [Siccirubricoccus deserti]